jgi:hypothetical protein
MHIQIQDDMNNIPLTMPFMMYYLILFLLHILHSDVELINEITYLITLFFNFELTN